MQGRGSRDCSQHVVGDTKGSKRLRIIMSRDGFTIGLITSIRGRLILISVSPATAGGGGGREPRAR